ncbi:LysR family transcriptional regulator [Granulosicoccus sp. 3-233]|uniref:LysR family transcriptional regulator n=1 Tax=Granulosicoccus sp. 3-233 TaxID=3417969 RepID=UPI003D335046
MDTIEGMRTFVAVAAEGSFTAGARRMGISTKLASKYVQQLEARLGAQLFSRTTRSVRVTDTGRAYLERCMPLLDQFDELEGLVQARQSELAGSIRLSAPTAFGSSALPAALARFQQQHPKVRIDLQLSDNWVALVEEGFDLAVRFGNLDDSSLVARRLLTMRLVVVASPAYLQREGEPETPAALSAHNCLVQDLATAADLWTFHVDDRPVQVRIKGTFRANSPRAIAHMAAQGLGIGRCPKYVADPFLQNGELRVLFEEHEASTLNLQALYPASRHLNIRVRALIDHLVEHFTDAGNQARLSPYS